MAQRPKAMPSEPDKKSQPRDPLEGANGGIEESGKVDRIRDILFGSQMRDYEGRFEKLEQHLVQEANDLRSDMQRRLEALERFIKGEVESINNRANAEHTDRCNALDKLGRDLGDAARHFDSKINTLNEQTGKSLAELRELLLEQSKTLSADIKEKHDQMKAGLDHEAAQIRNAMTGREALAEMLSEVALRLKNEFRVPGA